MKLTLRSQFFKTSYPWILKIIVLQNATDNNLSELIHLEVTHCFKNVTLNAYPEMELLWQFGQEDYVQ